MPIIEQYRRNVENVIGSYVVQIDVSDQFA